MWREVASFAAGVSLTTAIGWALMTDGRDVEGVTVGSSAVTSDALADSGLAKKITDSLEAMAQDVDRLHRHRIAPATRQAVDQTAPDHGIALLAIEERLARAG